MSDLFDFDKPPALYAVMGNPVEHSRSPEIHQAFAKQASVAIDYQRIHVDVGGFPQAVGSFEASGGRGLNITLPFKGEAWELVDNRTERAQLARAVNTLWFEGGTVFGDNTDGVGICRDITGNLSCTIAGRRILVVGAGGAVRGVLGELLACRPATVVVANRTVDKAVELIQLYRESSIQVLGCGFGEIAGLSFDIVINGTSASLSNQIPDIPALEFGRDSLAYDMVYAPQPTAFMRWAAESGARHTSDGLGMLVEQAAESFHIWHGFRPETKPVIATLRN